MAESLEEYDPTGGSLVEFDFVVRVVAIRTL